MQPGFAINPLDILLAALLLFGMYRGSKQGVVKRGALILAVLLSLLGGARFQGMFESIYRDYLGLNISGQSMLVLSYATAFVVIYVLANALLGSLAGFLKRVKLDVDSALGALLGGALTALIISVALNLLINFNFPSQQNKDGSMLYQPIKDFAGYAVGFSGQMLGFVNQGVNQIGNQGGPPAPGPASPQNGQPLPPKPSVIR